MHPSYYNTWLGDSLMDYGIPLTFVQSASAEQRMASSALRAVRSAVTTPRGHGHGHGHMHAHMRQLSARSTDHASALGLLSPGTPAVRRAARACACGWLHARSVRCGGGGCSHSYSHSHS